jgi:autotransporter passenger strand-loop-strand repeat protein
MVGISPGIGSPLMRERRYFALILTGGSWQGARPFAYASWTIFTFGRRAARHCSTGPHIKYETRIVHRPKAVPVACAKWHCGCQTHSDAGGLTSDIVASGGATINNGGVQQVFSGGIVSNTLVNSGGLLYVSARRGGGRHRHQYWRH